MRIVCPSCAAAYEVPEQRISPGRMVRCARCAREWAPVAAAAVAPAPVVPPSAPPVARPEPKLERLAAAPGMRTPILSVPQARPVPIAAPPEPGRPDRGVALGWIVSVVILVALAAAAYAKRDEIVRAWPASERAYAALGIPVRQVGSP